MSSHDEDPTVPGGRPAGGGDGSEDRTLPSGGRAADDRNDAPDDRTVPALDRELVGVGGSELVGKTIGGCRIDRLLGRGAMGAVYKARQLRLDRDVAVKVIRPEMMTDPRMLKRFEVEARTVGRFNSAHVVMVHDVGFELGVHYLVMEFVQGQNLREHVKMLAGGRLPVGDALPLIRQACKGLDEARRLGVVHRDIKPDNLMLTEHGVLKIADFGIAKPVEDDFSMTLTSELIGTPLYMSPEQCQGGAEIDFRSDMYSLGATFFYLLTGEPPIRASSVYELIQTKTKLENLCLWKALPELDENNPLSRVIERMTANDRDDRYESYEELLNDLVLVEAGETIRTPARKVKAPKAAPAAAVAAVPAKRSALPVALLVVVLLAAGGGGFWWWQQNQPDPGGTGRQVANGATPVPPGPDGAGGPLSVEDARQQLGRLRARLRDDGPSAALRDDVAALAVPAALVDVRERLGQDVAAGLEVEARLAGLERPAELAPPFAALRAHFAAVDAAAELDAAAGPELRAWGAEAREAALAAGELGASAAATLLGAFTKWQEDRARVGSDDKRLAELGDRLGEIEQGRRTLYDLLPDRRAALDRDLPQARLDAARRGLTESAPMQPADVDVSGALAEIRAELLAKGPTDSLRNRARDLKPTRSEQSDERDELLDAIDRGRSAAEQARALQFPGAPVAPFQDVQRFYAGIDRALQPLRSAEGELPGWAAALRVELRGEPQLQAAVIEACRALWEAWQRERDGGATTVTLEQRKAELDAATAAAERLFPAAGAALAQAVPPAEVDAAMRAVRLLAKRATWRSSLADANERLTDVDGLQEWTAAEAALSASARTLRDALGDLDDDGALQPQLVALERGLDAWRTAQQRFGRAAQLFGQGQLADCATELDVARAGPARAECNALAELVTQCRSAFEQFRSALDIAAARQALEAVRARVAAQPGLPASVSTRVDAWLSGLTKLERATTGMVPIPAGRSEPAFFLAATECSCDEFARFVNEVRAAAVGDDDEARFAAVEARLQGSGMTPAMLRSLLARRERTGRTPIDRVNWHEAAAYAAWHGYSLPTREQWTLAALGDGGRHRYPWGDGDGNDPQERNISDRMLVEVDQGGLSWRSASGPALHHLGGNVAEWLAAPLEDRRALVAGGRYNERRAPQLRAAAGEAADYNKLEDLPGFGFRVALRPESFPGLSWPR